ncbi:MAG TPA: arsenate reductase ArsC [bacterium]|nr:arsenate reductase ArsC [bacterium]
MERVLFICVYNSARSQMAEAFMRKYGEERFVAESAGLEPGTINPLVVEVMNEEGIDLADKGTNSVYDYYRDGRSYDYVITVCSKDAAERCPIFPGGGKRLHWPFDDPSKVKGTYEEKLVEVRRIRNAIREQILWFLESSGGGCRQSTP